MILGETSGRRFPTAEEVEVIAAHLSPKGITVADMARETGIRRDRALKGLKALLKQSRVYYRTIDDRKVWFPIRRQSA